MLTPIIANTDRGNANNIGSMEISTSLPNSALQIPNTEIGGQESSGTDSHEDRSATCYDVMRKHITNNITDQDRKQYPKTNNVSQLVTRTGFVRPINIGTDGSPHRMELRTERRHTPLLPHPPSSKRIDCSMRRHDR